MAYTFSATFYPDVRARIGPEATDVTVPDEMLQLAVYKGEAERFIMRSLTEAQYTDPAFSDEADYAATLYLASLVVTTLRVVDSENLAGGGKMTYAKFDATKIATELLAQANARIAEVLKAYGSSSADVMPDNPNFFVTTQKRYPEEDGIVAPISSPFLP